DCRWWVESIRLNFFKIKLCPFCTKLTMYNMHLTSFHLTSFLLSYLGWSKECLVDWKSYIQLAVPGMVMMCVEWWTYEIGGFLAGLISEVELGTQSVVYQLANIAYMFPLGFSVAGNVRVGNALGAGETEQAKLPLGMLLFTTGSVSNLPLLEGCVTSLVVKSNLFFYTSHDQAASGGIIRGAGKQRVGAICYFLGFYGIGFPIGIPLMFVAKQGIKGAQSEDAEHSLSVTDAMDLVDTEEVSLEVQPSFRSLVLRRGLALAGMLLVLATGITINLLVTNLVT
uniref:Solute carrier family 47 member 3 n=1 Tax=Xiphophorus couchianus TaxID=32473 RepID=A0A3B5LR01_9TELE